MSLWTTNVISNCLQRWPLRPARALRLYYSYFFIYSKKSLHVKSLLSTRLRGAIAIQKWTFPHLKKSAVGRAVSRAIAITKSRSASRLRRTVRAVCGRQLLFLSAVGPRRPRRPLGDKQPYKYTWLETCH